MVFNPIVPILLFILSRVITSFADTTKEITIGSHNLYGFKTSAPYHKECIKKYGGIWFGQEHWLPENKLSQLQQLEAQFVARSGMEHAISNGIWRGRPFGGVSIAWSSDLNHVITPVSNYRHKRVVAVELHTKKDKFLLLSIYMPFYDTRNRDRCLTETAETLTMIESLIDGHPQHLIIIGGDLNTELKGNSNFDPLWEDMVARKQLAYCTNLFSSPGYTYHQETLGHKKMIDHFIVSKSIITDGTTYNHQILDDGANAVSDHLPIIMQISIQTPVYIPPTPPNPTAPVLRWSSIDDSAKQRYTDHLDYVVTNLEPLRLPSDCTGGCHCVSECCQYVLQEEYDALISCIKISDAQLPRQKPGVKKDWWTSELTDIKKQSIDIYNVWIAEGRPHQGPIHTEKVRVRAAFKRALRIAQRAPKLTSWNRLHTSMQQNDTNGFWTSWRSLYNKNQSQFAPVVDGCSTKEGIAEAFRKSFKENSEPNNITKVTDLNDQFSACHKRFEESHSSNCDCQKYQATLKGTIEAICSMENGKCGDEDGINAEHFHYAPLSLLKRLTRFINLMLSHSFVPSQFRRGYMIPIVKDSQGSLSDVSNYRGITISPIFSKIFEHTLKVLFTEHLTTSNLQFGFKKKASTVQALYCLRQTVNYYVTHGSRVYCGFLDASKAFDRLVHSGLFIKLMERKVPKIFLDIIMSWYDGLFCRVLWDGHFSEWFHVSAGVRQGGVLSPDLYNIYVNDLICILESSGVGCFVLDKFAAALMYADDIAILAPSIKGLQKLLSLCEDYCLQWDIRLNSKKTKNLCFGKGESPKFKLRLNNEEIDWVNRWKYLGVNLLSGPSFGCCVAETCNKFYRAANSVLRVEGRSDDTVMLSLLEAHCTPILSYAMEVIHVADSAQFRKLRVAYNSIFRKLFNYSWRQSVTNLQHELGRPTWEELVESCKAKFLDKVSNLPPTSHVRALNY